MAQQYSSDAQAQNAFTALPLGVTVSVLTTNPLPVPFETAKAKVSGFVSLKPGALETFVDVFVIRNVNAEALQILGMAVQPEAAGNTIAIPFACTDDIPDGRDVSYTVQVQCETVNGAMRNAYIEATLLSG